MSTIYLPDTHGYIPAVIKIGDKCYEYIESVPRNEQEETNCWNEVTHEYDECEDCCFPNLEYGPCAECPDNEPSIYVTLTGYPNDGPGGSVNVDFAGEIWVLPDESGVEKGPICPSSYLLRRVTTQTAAYGGSGGNENWVVNSLRFYRAYSKLNYGAGPTFGTFSFIIQGTYIRPYNYLKDNYLYSHFPATTAFTTSYYGANFLTGVPLGSVSDYRITDDYFGSFTNNGITYSWRRGSGW
jgi:hypothetical protein